VLVAVLPFLASPSSLCFLYSQKKRVQFIFVFFLDGLFSFPAEDRAINLEEYREVFSRVLVSYAETVLSLLIGGLVSVVVCDVNRF
jgi:hypothetical protein